MCTHHTATQWTPFYDPIENATFAVGVCQNCHASVTIACDDCKTAYVIYGHELRNAMLVCVKCDLTPMYIPGRFVWLRLNDDST